MSTEHSAVAEPIVLHMGRVLTRLSEDEFFEFCQLNRDLRIERTGDGDLIIMPPTGGKTGRRNVSLTTQLENWSAVDGTGIVFDSSTGFRLANGAKRSPDVAWVVRDRWDALTDDEQEEFPPLAPDFVVELRSRSDSVADLKAKMAEYIENGVRLGWLLDPTTRTVWVYSADGAVSQFDAPETLAGDPILPGFTLRLDAIWR